MTDNEYDSSVVIDAADDTSTSTITEYDSASANETEYDDSVSTIILDDGSVSTESDYDSSTSTITLLDQSGSLDFEYDASDVSDDEYDSSTVSDDEAETLITRGLKAWWQLNEESGATAVATPSTLFNGVISNIDGYRQDLGDGTLGLEFTDANVNIYTPALVSSWDGLEFTLSIEASFDTATPASTQTIFIILTDSSNSAQMQQLATANTIRFFYEAGGIIEVYDAVVPTLTTGKHKLTMTVSKSNNELKTFVDGVQVGTTQTIAGTYVGAPNSAFCNVGSDSTSRTFNHNGKAANARYYNVALTEEEVAQL